jgi:hypothetical protein
MLSKNYAKKHDHLGMEGEGALGGMLKDLQGQGGGVFIFKIIFFWTAKGYKAVSVWKFSSDLTFSF